MLTPDDIAKVVSNWTGVPVVKLTETEAKKLLDEEYERAKRLKYVKLNIVPTQNIIIGANANSGNAFKTTKYGPNIIFSILWYIAFVQRGWLCCRHIVRVLKFQTVLSL